MASDIRMLTRQYVGGVNASRGTTGHIIEGGVQTNLFELKPPGNVKLVYQYDGPYPPVSRYAYMLTVVFPTMASLLIFQSVRQVYYGYTNCLGATDLVTICSSYVGSHITPSRQVESPRPESEGSSSIGDRCKASSPALSGSCDPSLDVQSAPRILSEKGLL